MTRPAHSLSIWVISDGRRGIENQALGLAEAIRRLRPASIKTHVIANTRLFKALRPRVQYAFCKKPGRYGLPSALPDMAIGCGRQAIAPLLALKARGVFTSYVQDPRIDPRAFNMVIAPRHDRLSGNNTLSIIGSPNRITQDGLQTARKDFKAALAPYPAPRIAVLVGGNSKMHRLTQSNVQTHLDAFQDLLNQGYSLLMTVSRRTPDFAVKAYQDFAATQDHVWLWDGDGDNPYFAYLDAAQAILVTRDSTNMLTEACATGHPVYTLPIEARVRGHEGKFTNLYQELEAAYGVTPFMGKVSNEDKPPLRETSRAAHAVLQAYDDMQMRA